MRELRDLLVLHIVHYEADELNDATVNARPQNLEKEKLKTTTGKQNHYKQH
jgi:hypothetical protein